MTDSSPPNGAGKRAESDPTADMTTRVIRASFWSLAGLLLPQWYTFVSSVFLARLLAPSAYGELTLISFTAMTLGTVLTLGFPGAVNRHVAATIGAGAPNDLPSLYRWTWRWGSGVATVGALSIWAVALLGGEPRSAWALAGVVAATTVLHQIPSVLLMGAGRWRDARVVGITTGALSLVARIVVLLLGGGVVPLIAVDAVVGVTNVACTSTLARRALRALAPAPRRAPELIRDTIRFALKASVATVITWVVFRRSEIFFLEHYSSKEQIVIYSLPFSLVQTLIYVPQATVFVLTPAFATLFGAGELDRMRLGFERSLRIVTAFTLLLSAYVLVVAQAAVLVVYGSQYAESGTILRILLATLPFVPLMSLSTGLLNGMGKQWFATAALGVAAVVNLSLDLVLVQHFDARGAAVANTIAQVVGTLPILLYARRAVGGIELDRWFLARVTLVSTASAAAAAVPVALLSPWPGLLLGSVVFGGAFLALTGFVPTLRPDDAEVLAERAGARLGGVPRAVVRWSAGRGRSAASPSGGESV